MRDALGCCFHFSTFMTRNVSLHRMIHMNSWTHENTKRCHFDIYDAKCFTSPHDSYELTNSRKHEKMSWSLKTKISWRLTTKMQSIFKTIKNGTYNLFFLPTYKMLHSQSNKKKSISEIEANFNQQSKIPTFKGHDWTKVGKAFFIISNTYFSFFLNSGFYGLSGL